MLSAARAVQSRSEADIDRAMTTNLAMAHAARGYAENAIQFAAFLGRPDVAFQIADAYYFNRGFSLGRLSFSKEAGQFYEEPRTHFLFFPSCAAIRGDLRFDRLMGDLGLKAYWAAAGRPPDYIADRG